APRGALLADSGSLGISRAWRASRHREAIVSEKRSTAPGCVTSRGAPCSSNPVALVPPDQRQWRVHVPVAVGRAWLFHGPASDTAIGVPAVGLRCRGSQ